MVFVTDDATKSISKAVPDTCSTAQLLALRLNIPQIDYAFISPNCVRALAILCT
jgi:hypothetical protein